MNQLKQIPKRGEPTEIKSTYITEGVNWLLDDPEAYYAKKNKAKKEKSC